MDEKNLSPQKEDISESYNEIFNYNTVNVESEMMNRDYLHHIYDEDMDSLSKVTLLTRTQHLRRVEETKQSFEKEINQKSATCPLMFPYYIRLFLRCYSF